MNAAVGRTVTYQVGSDRYVGTIVSVSKSGRSFYFRDNRGGGDDPKELHRAFLNKQYQWRWKWNQRSKHSWFVWVGVHDPYLDPLF